MRLLIAAGWPPRRASPARWRQRTGRRSGEHPSRYSAAAASQRSTGSSSRSSLLSALEFELRRAGADVDASANSCSAARSPRRCSLLLGQQAWRIDGRAWRAWLGRRSRHSPCFATCGSAPQAIRGSASRGDRHDRQRDAGWILLPGRAEVRGRRSPGAAWRRVHSRLRRATAWRRIRTALLAMQERVGTLDAKMFVTSLLIQRETGGNLSEVLGGLATPDSRSRRVARPGGYAHGRAEVQRSSALAAAGGGILRAVLPESRHDGSR